MPKGGWFFDAIVRQPPIDEEKLNIEDNLEEFGLLSDDDVDYFRMEAERLYSGTDKAIFANFGGMVFGDIALVPATWLKYPRGIRDIEEWHVGTMTRRDHVYQVFERQCEIALENLKRAYKTVGNKVSLSILQVRTLELRDPHSSHLGLSCSLSALSQALE